MLVDMRCGSSWESCCACVAVVLLQGFCCPWWITLKPSRWTDPQSPAWNQNPAQLRAVRIRYHLSLMLTRSEPAVDPVRPFIVMFFLQALCEHIFSNDAFSSCQNLLDVGSFTEACMVDMCISEDTSDLVLCKTISEFSRQCVHAGGSPAVWRNDTFCSKNISLASAPPCWTNVVLI